MATRGQQLLLTALPEFWEAPEPRTSLPTCAPPLGAHLWGSPDLTTPCSSGGTWELQGWAHWSKAASGPASGKGKSLVWSGAL